MTLKRPERINKIITTTGSYVPPPEPPFDRGYNQAITEYDAWLAEAMKELREEFQCYVTTGGAEYNVIRAIRNFIERVDHENK